MWRRIKCYIGVCCYTLGAIICMVLGRAARIVSSLGKNFVANHKTGKIT